LIAEEPDRTKVSEWKRGMVFRICLEPETPYADALLRRPRHDPDLMTGVFLGLTGLTSLWK
jgi:hypothetical protein